MPRTWHVLCDEPLDETALAGMAACGARRLRQTVELDERPFRVFAVEAESGDDAASAVATVLRQHGIDPRYLEVRFVALNATAAEAETVSRRLAIDLVDGAWQSVVERCAGDEALTAAVSLDVADVLVEKAAGHARALPPEEAVWPGAQVGFMALAELVAADGDRMVDALFDACTWESVHGPATALRGETLRWMLNRIPDRVGHLIDLGGRQGREHGHDVDPRFVAAHPYAHAEDRQIVDALWRLPGQAGARWMLRMLPRHDLRAVATWTADDWNLRLEALSTSRLDPPPGLHRLFGLAGGPPPPQTAAAQVRLACVYAVDPTDWLVRSVADNLRSYRGGDPATDARLFWWAAPTRDQVLLCWLLELSGPAGSREPVVAAAHAAGWIDEPARRALAHRLERPEWADGEVPWEISEILDAGSVRLPDGRLAGGDPWWSFEGLPWVLEVEPGRYPVRVVVASHPLQGRMNAAAELLVDAEATPWRWQPVGAEAPGAEDYIVEVGVGSFGAAATLCPGLGEELPGDVFGGPTSAEVDGADVGSLVLFTVGPQHQECRTWVGSDREGRIVRLVTDLGLLDLDPPTSGLPWA